MKRISYLRGTVHVELDFACPTP